MCKNVNGGLQVHVCQELRRVFQNVFQYKMFCVLDFVMFP